MTCDCVMIRVKRRNPRSNNVRGVSFDPLYKLWSAIRSRCNDGTVHGNNPSYKKIKISKEWANSFHVFKEDIGNKPSQAHSIDRIDNLRGYCRHNCRWATSYEQSINRRIPSFSVEKNISRKNNKFVVRIQIPAQEKWLGSADTIPEARKILARALARYEEVLNRIEDQI